MRALIQSGCRRRGVSDAGLMPPTAIVSGTATPWLVGPGGLNIGSSRAIAVSLGRAGGTCRRPERVTNPGLDVAWLPAELLTGAARGCPVRDARGRRDDFPEVRTADDRAERSEERQRRCRNPDHRRLSAPDPGSDADRVAKGR